MVEETKVVPQPKVIPPAPVQPKVIPPAPAKTAEHVAKSSDIVKVKNIAKHIIHVKSGPLEPGKIGEATLAEAQAYYNYVERV